MCLARLHYFLLHHGEAEDFVCYCPVSKSSLSCVSQVQIFSYLINLQSFY